MRRIFFGVVASLSLLGWAAAARAATIIQISNNYGNQYNNGAWNHTFGNVYGNSNAVPPEVSVPIVTSTSDGTLVTFSPLGFFAKTNSSTGLVNQTFDGALSLLVTFDSPVFLTTKLSEGGSFVSGDGKTSVQIDVAISPLDGVGDSVLQGTSKNTFVTSGEIANWSINKQYAGFNVAHSTFLISIDNILEADVPLSSTLNASIDKKFFSLTLITDGGGEPPVPEPATLGVLATGCLALLARRRRA
jgi:hypothetical protein